MFLTLDNSWPTIWMMAWMPGKSNRKNYCCRTKWRQDCLDKTRPSILRSSHPYVVLRKGVLKISSKFSEDLFLKTPLTSGFCQDQDHVSYILEVNSKRSISKKRFFFSIKTFITMYKQTIYSQQKLIKIIWLKCHKW